MTPKQKRAKERNFAKMRVSGMLASAKNLSHANFISPAEKIHLSRTVQELNSILLHWDGVSRVIFNMNTTGSKKK